MNPILLAHHVRESLTELIRTTLNTTSPPFEEIVDRFLENPNNFLKGPWVSADMPFRQVASEDNNWNEPFPEIPLKFPPYQHQMEAFDRICGSPSLSTLIATGTGSGKTECYLWPILDHCRQMKERPGIKAILIYPMNALANDQARRIAKALTSNSSLAGIRAGIYADEEKSDASNTVTEDSIIGVRQSMRDSPPDILLTNYKMLDQLLLRGRDKNLWESNSPDTLKFLVVDELHTFDGAQGADLALLIRRLKSRLQVPEKHLVCIGSSATLGVGEEVEKDLCKYAETIFDEEFSGEAVIREKRLTHSEVFEEPEYFDCPDPVSVLNALTDASEMEQPAAAMHMAQCLFHEKSDSQIDALHSGDPSTDTWRDSLGKVLISHHICQRILKFTGDSSRPVSFSEIAEDLSVLNLTEGRKWDEDQYRKLAELIISLVSWARSGKSGKIRPLFNVRLQVWYRELVRMVANLPNSRSVGSSEERSSEVNLYHSEELDPDDLERMLPIANCTRCGTAAFIGLFRQGKSHFWAPLNEIYDAYFNNTMGDKIQFFYYSDIDTIGKRNKKSKSVIRGILDPDTIEFKVLDDSGDDENESPPANLAWKYNPYDQFGRLDRTCVACGQQHSIVIFGMRAAMITSGITSALYSSMQNELEMDAKPRLLMFSDSVQDAAHRGSVAEIRNSRMIVQKTVYNVLANRQNQSLSLDEVYEKVPQQVRDQFGVDNFVALFIAKEHTWQEFYQDLVKYDKSVEDSMNVNFVATRFGWEMFAYLTYLSHNSHTLESNFVTTAEVVSDMLVDSAENLHTELQNFFTKMPIPEPELLIRFLFGILQKMRRHGAVGHPYVESGIRNDQERGLNFHAGARSQGFSQQNPFPSPNFRRFPAPTPLTINKRAPGYLDITRKHSTNWYRDWLLRILSMSENLTKNTDIFQLGSEFDVILATALTRLAQDKLVEKIERPGNHSGNGYVIRPEKITVSNNVARFECSVCNRREINLAVNSQHYSGSPCTRSGCTGKLAQIDLQPRISLQRSLVSNRNSRVVAREHTGLLDSNERFGIEEGFINNKAKWAPNLISATPTLEMGIDIGELSTLLLCAIPPEESNYIQRIGRSGRRDGNALNMSIANAKPHDLQFWEDPYPMLNGEVRAPGVHIEAEAVLLRQVAAFTLDKLVASGNAPESYGNVGDVLSKMRSGQNTGFLNLWISFIKNHGKEIADSFLVLLPDNVRSQQRIVECISDYLTLNSDVSLQWRVMEEFGKAEKKRERLLDLKKDLTNQLRRLRNRRSEMTERRFEIEEGEINRFKRQIDLSMRREIDEVNILKFLTLTGILPNYAFPDDSIELKSVLLKRSKDSDEKDDELKKYVRPAHSAMSEFAPGQIFYAEGRQVEIKRIELTQDDITVLKFCQSCSFIAPKIEETSESKCPNCNDEMWIDSGTDHQVIQLKSVVAVTTEDKAAITDNDRRDQKNFDKSMFPHYSKDDIGVSWVTSESEVQKFGYEYIKKCKFRDINFGRKSQSGYGPKISGEFRNSQAFPICKFCGTLQKLDFNNSMSNDHHVACPIYKADGKLQSDWQINAFLLREFETEAIRIIIPTEGEMDVDDIKSFVAGINLGMQKHFSGRIDHIKSEVVKTHLSEIAVVNSLYLFDTVPGGTGYLRQLAENPESMHSVIYKSMVALRDCPCAKEEKSGCFRCVKSYRSQFGPGEPDRGRALHLMETILQLWDSLKESDGDIEDVIRDDQLESELERLFLEKLKRTFGSESLTRQVLKGGNRGYLLSIPVQGTKRNWNIEPQVKISRKFHGLPDRRVDFLFTPVGNRDELPLVVEMDGLEFHFDKTEQDLLARMDMIRSGHVGVWTMSFHDLQIDSNFSENNPLNRNSTNSPSGILLDEILSNEMFSDFTESLESVRHKNSYELFCEVLEGKHSDLASTCSILLRSIVGKGIGMDEVQSFKELNEESQLFLDIPKLFGHCQENSTNLFISCDKISPKEWESTTRDLRIVVKSDLPVVNDVSEINIEYKKSWHGLWRMFNLFQQLGGFHLDYKGIDTLSPPDMSRIGKTQYDDKWQNIITLFEGDNMLDLIKAMIEADIKPPNLIGEDIIGPDKRVVGTVDFGWSSEKVAIASDMIDGCDFRIIPYTISESPIIETINELKLALRRN